MNVSSSIKLSLRALRRDKTFSIINILGLSLGLACCAFVFLYAFHSLTYDHYHQDYKNIYRINSSWVGTAEKRSMAITAPTVSYTLASNYSFIESACTISAINNPETLQAAGNSFALSNFREGNSETLNVFNFQLINGTKQDQGIYLNEEWAKKVFGRVDCIGERVSINDQHYQVNGVYENWPQNVDLKIDVLLIQEYDPNDWERFGFITYAKINGEKVALQQALQSISDDLYNQEKNGNDYILLEAQAMDGLHFDKSIVMDQPKGNQTYTYLALTTAVILIVIVLINISNLSVIRGIDAIRMNGIRKILGASKTQIRAYQLVQLVILIGISLIIAITLFQLITPYFQELTGVQILMEEHASLLLLFSLTFISLIILVGMASERLSGRINPINALKNQISNNLSGGQLRKSLVILQFVITGFVMSGLLILMLQWNYIQSKDLGFNPENVAVISLTEDSPDLTAVRANLTALVGDQNVSMGTWGTIPGADVPFTTATIPETNMNIPVNVIDYDPNFLNVFEIGLIKGTIPTTRITEEGQTQPVLVNQAMSQLLADPLETNISMVWLKGKIAGIVADYHYQSLHNTIEPLILIPQQQEAVYTHIFIKTPMNRLSDIASLLSKTLEPTQYNLQLLDQKLLVNYQQEQEAISLIFYFSLISLFISILGIVGVVSYILKKREYEIGIRKILGAQLNHLYQLFGREMALLIVIAGVISIPCGYYLKSQILALYAFKVDFSWWYLLVPMAVTILSSMTIVLYQIKRASTVDPVKLLRDE
ncbi:ABC transporter permease [Marinoscillum sp.]|uniref:ABC transporter permease n=1 Tax=Marinoscillum sp. TaxID=2024838 RepID=UPI003BA9B7F1